MVNQYKTATFTARVAATDLKTRELVKQVRLWLNDSGVSSESCGEVEITLTEALNNVCEHAFADLPPGTIDMEAGINGGQLTLILVDNGHPQPNRVLPAGRLPDSNIPLDKLPEGGFGWFLIYELTDSQSYIRDGCNNRLELIYTLKPALK